MRVRIIVSIGLMLVVSSEALGFDVEAYVRDCNSVDWARDVNALKSGLLGHGKLGDIVGSDVNEEFAGEVLAGMFLDPPCDRVKITVTIVPVLLRDESVFSDTKCRVVEAMIKRAASEELLKYGIDAVDDLGTIVPILYVKILIYDTVANGETIYAIHIGTQQNEFLIRPTSGHKVVATTWEQSGTTLCVSDRFLEELILGQAALQMDEFTSEQYGRCVFREAVRQLETEGKLPKWLRGKSEAENEQPEATQEVRN